MKPVLLKIRGFTAFRDETVVEFSGRRLFVITGPTGAGKSSLLDAMTWALYGQVPRVGRSVKELVSQGERDMSVLFEFTVRGRGYRVARRYPGNTSTRLERLVNEQWVPVSDRAADVTREVETLLGMDYATFTRAIVLPQGDFDSFLRGDAKDRRAILSQLIGLGVYQRAGELARARAAQHKAQADTIRTQLEKMTLATPEVIATLDQQLADLATKTASLAERRKALAALGELARTHRDQQDAATRAANEARAAEGELAEAQRALATAEAGVAARLATVERLTAELSALTYDAAEHDRLKAAVALLDQRAGAEAALAEARQALASARRDAEAARTAEAEARARAEAATKTLTEAEKAARAATTTLGKAIGKAHRALELATTAAGEAERTASEADARARGLSERVTALRNVEQELKRADADLARAADAVTRATRDHDARAKEAAKAATARDRAEDAATQARDALDRARAEDAAAHLRAGLKVGDPCPVCGEPIAKVGKHAAPNLAKVEQALTKATIALTEARSTAETASAAVAAADARVEATASALAAAEAHRDALAARLSEYDVAADALPQVIEDTARLAARESEAAETARAGARTQTAAAQALRETLARVPSSIEPTEAKRVGDADAVRAELVEALETHALSEASRTAAERDATAAATAAASTSTALTTADREAARAERDVATAEQRLVGLGGVEGDPTRVRKALAEAEQQAAKGADLTTSLGQEREALAALEASRAASLATRDRAAAALTKRREVCTGAEAMAAAALAALASSWRETIGAGTPSIPALRTEQESFIEQERQTQEALISARVAREQASTQAEQAASMQTDAEDHQAKASLIGSVGLDLQGNRFIAYLLNESMELLAADASERLSNFTNGRYALVADEDTFQVMDHLNGDELRSVRTLSGGETFLASLALALALSEHLPEISGTGGAVSLDSLFLDEGFGALDAEALDLAVQGLETLAEDSRMIGVISHVEELSERLPDRIRVEKGSHGSTVVA